MSSPVHGISADRPITDARDRLLRYGHGCLLVDGGTEPGLLRRRDVELAIHHGNGALPVGDYAVTAVTIGPDEPIDQVALRLPQQGRVMVVDRGRVIGLISHSDWLRTQGIEDSAPNLDVWQRLGAALPAHSIALLTDVGQLAAAAGLNLYVVGGLVRDLLRLVPGERLTLVDIDLVVDGMGWESSPPRSRPPVGLTSGQISGQISGQTSGAIILAEAIQARYPEVQLELFGKFQTAALTWPQDSTFGGLSLDIATARLEFYPHPAANPEVEASTIGADLYRRDFTINALAIGLSGSQAGRLIDRFGGLRDLRSGLIRIIHPHSFIEDPTRIFRAARFATRLGFDLAPETAAQLAAALASGTYGRLLGQAQSGQPLPSLQLRLRAELETILGGDHWRSTLTLLDRWGALACLDPDLSLNRERWSNLSLADWAWRRLADQGDVAPPTWLRRLERLLADLPNAATIAQTLQLPKDSRRRLGLLADRRAQLAELIAAPNDRASVPPCDRPSRIYDLLHGWDLPSIVLLLNGEQPQRQRLWCYLSRWRRQAPPLDGSDLTALGYKPGKQYKAMLRDLLLAQLDGKLVDRQAAIDYLTSRYPIG